MRGHALHPNLEFRPLGKAWRLGPPLGARSEAGVLLCLSLAPRASPIALFGHCLPGCLRGVRSAHCCPTAWYRPGHPVGVHQKITDCDTSEKQEGGLLRVAGPAPQPAGGREFCRSEPSDCRPREPVLCRFCMKGTHGGFRGISSIKAPRQLRRPEGRYRPSGHRRGRIHWLKRFCVLGSLDSRVRKTESDWR